MKIFRTNIEVFPIGQGTLFGRSFDGQASIELVNKKIKVLEYGLELGMNFIDTGEDYENGFSEKLLSKIISVKRSKIIIGSKFKPSNNAYENVLKAVEGSLSRMKTDYIDIYQIQWPNPNVPIEETISALNKLVEQGKIRYFGVGNFSINQLNEALKFDYFKKLSVLQTEYDLFNRLVEKEILSFNQLNEITTIAYMSFGKNLYTENEKKILTKLADKYNKSIRSIVLNWITSHRDLILLTSSMSEEHTLQNFESQSFQLLNEEVNEINDNFLRKSIMVSPKKIKVLNYDESDTAHLIYTTLQEAKENKLNIKPSAIEISEEIKSNGDLLRPIELKLNPNQSENQPYLLVRGRMRFWGWIIAFGYEKEIECKIF